MESPHQSFSVSVSMGIVLPAFSIRLQCFRTMKATPYANALAIFHSSLPTLFPFVNHYNALRNLCLSHSLFIENLAALITSSKHAHLQLDSNGFSVSFIPSTSVICVVTNTSVIRGRQPQRYLRFNNSIKSNFFQGSLRPCRKFPAQLRNICSTNEARKTLRLLIK